MLPSRSGPDANQIWGCFREKHWGFSEQNYFLVVWTVLVKSATRNEAALAQRECPQQSDTTVLNVGPTLNAAAHA